ncbi:hypothetical protein R5577_15740 [Xanthomonas euvesicatoria]|uniref:Uncharacterized protein n=1 Tax=Xanthomonas euvesicatoria TaxID=456327 RepID=A0AAX4FGP4_XANEU|nr:hypothetical protein [Xanthomonas euvesicatoria]WOP55687.1 hypothetical protein R5577_15740 [Xanthomonas euvesicatoria]
MKVTESRGLNVWAMLRWAQLAHLHFPLLTVGGIDKSERLALPAQVQAGSLQLGRIGAELSEVVTQARQGLRRGACALLQQHSPCTHGIARVVAGVVRRALGSHAAVTSVEVTNGNGFHSRAGNAVPCALKSALVQVNARLKLSASHASGCRLDATQKLGLVELPRGRLDPAGHSVHAHQLGQGFVLPSGRHVFLGQRRGINDRLAVLDTVFERGIELEHKGVQGNLRRRRHQRMPGLVPQRSRQHVQAVGPNGRRENRGVDADGACPVIVVPALIRLVGHFQATEGAQVDGLCHDRSKVRRSIDGFAEVTHRRLGKTRLLLQVLEQPVNVALISHHVAPFRA